jgi:RsiW-degrading membrane proteinase PrsW (M82 family)
VYLLVREWPPRVPIFTVAACLAIVIGVGLWFVERHEAFRPWRVVIHYVLLGALLAASAATIAWDLAGQAGR